MPPTKRAHTHERMLPQSRIQTYIHSRSMQPQNDSFLCSHSLSMCLYRHNSWQQHQFYFEKSVTRVQNTNDRPNDFSTKQQKRIFTPCAGPHCSRNESTTVAAMATTTTKTRRKNYMYFSEKGWIWCVRARTTPCKQSIKTRRKMKQFVSARCTLASTSSTHLHEPSCKRNSRVCLPLLMQTHESYQMDSHCSLICLHKLRATINFVYNNETAMRTNPPACKRSRTIRKKFFGKSIEHGSSDRARRWAAR